MSIADAREAVLEAAERVESGIAGPETLLLVERLERVTGAGIVELSRHAKDGASSAESLNQGFAFQTSTTRLPQFGLRLRIPCSDQAASRGSSNECESSPRRCCPGKFTSASALSVVPGYQPQRGQVPLYLGPVFRMALPVAPIAPMAALATTTLITSG